jgi:acetyl esterase/lipase
MRRQWLHLVGATAVLVSGVAVGRSEAASAGRSQPAGPEVTVEPSTDLLDGQEVTVEGSGLAAGDDFLLVMQCSTGAQSFEACDWSTSQFTQAADGAFTLTLSVRAILADLNGAETDCRVAEACVVGVGPYGSPDASPEAEVPLHFDPDGALLDPPTVSVEPNEGLVDGQTVSVSGTGFVRHTSVQVVQCAADPAPEAGACDDATSIVTTSDDGVIEVDVEVLAVIDTWAAGVVDCRVPGNCVVAATTSLGQPGDTAVAAVAFDPDAPLLRPPTIAVTPAADLVDGQIVQVDGSGFPVPDVGGTFVSIFQCSPTPSPESCRRVGDDFVEVAQDGSFTTDVAVAARVPASDGLTDCRGSSEPCLLVASPSSSPHSPRAGRAELHFDPDGSLLPEPEIEVTPSDRLGDFTTLVVRGSHFTPAARASVRVCVADPEPQRCDDGSGEHPIVDADGGFELDISAWSDFGLDLDGEADCRQPPGCVVAATDLTRGFDTTVPLGFGPPDPPRGRYLDPVFDEVEVERDVVYRETVDYQGNPVQLKLDIYRPAGDTVTRRPVAIWMHGGSFITGDKGGMSHMATEFARRGYVGVSLQYRLRPDMASDDVAGQYEASLDAHEDAIAAIEWLRAHAGEYGIDPDAIVAGGYSAGAVTALNLAYAPGQHGPDTSPVAAALPGSGLYLFPPDPGEPPSIVFHTTDDTVLPVNNGHELCPLAHQAGIACELVAWDSPGHYFRSRDIIRRGADFVATHVLEPAGYFDDDDCTVVGTEGKDRLVGTSGDDILCGLGGNDVILGRAGNDELRGGEGNDVLIGGRGDDLIEGGPGRDIAIGIFGRNRCSAEIRIRCPQL